MNEVRDQTFSAPVDVDDTYFVNCRFESAQLRYAGGPLPRFLDCTFDEVGWYFADAALRTIQLLQFQNNEGQAKAWLDELFKPGNMISE